MNTNTVHHPLSHSSLPTSPAIAQPCNHVKLLKGVKSLLPPTLTAATSLTASGDTSNIYPTLLAALMASIPSSPSPSPTPSKFPLPFCYDPTYPNTPVPDNPADLGNLSFHHRYSLRRAEEVAQYLLTRGVITGDYEIDIQGMLWDSLIKALSPKYDDPATGLPVFAVWADGREDFPLDRSIKIGAAVLMVTLEEPGKEREKRRSFRACRDCRDCQDHR